MDPDSEQDSQVNYHTILNANNTETSYIICNSSELAFLKVNNKHQIRVRNQPYNSVQTLLDLT